MLPAPARTSTRRAVGRPTDYSCEAADAICGLLAEGYSLRAICATDGAPDRSTVFRWLVAHPEFRDQYRLARELQADTLADECIEIADAAEPTRLALDHAVVRVKARQWCAARMKPRVYGDVPPAHAPERGPVAALFAPRALPPPPR